MRDKFMGGITFIVIGLILSLASGSIASAERVEATIDVVQDSKMTLVIDDTSLEPGQGAPGDVVSGVITGSVESDVSWRLTYQATDFKKGSLYIPISNATIAGTGLEHPIVLGRSGVIYDEVEPVPGSDFDFTHIFSLLIPSDTEPGKYRAYIEYTAIQIP